MAVRNTVGSADSDDRSRFERLLLDARSRFLASLSYLHQSRGRDFIDWVASAAEGRAWEKFHTFNPERASFYTWLSTIARHEAEAESKRRQPGPEFSYEGLAETSMEPAVAGPSEYYDTAELRRRLWQAVRELPRPLRFPFILQACDGYSIAEIGERYGMSKCAIANRLDHARKFLARRLGPGWNGRGLGTDWAKGSETDGSVDD